MSELRDYAVSLVGGAGQEFVSGDVFAKVLTQNDDSGRHGVLVPSDAYSYFPVFEIADPTINQTREFGAFNSIARSGDTLAYKYYERYPERRLTRLPAILSSPRSAQRLLIFLNAKHSDGTSAYYFDCANSDVDGRFDILFRLIFGAELSSEPGRFVVRPVDSAEFSTDSILEELLGKFDEVNSLGWIDSLRLGDTGIGYTFEKLLGIEENNDQTADFKGIEIKCKGTKEGQFSRSTKINLFQEGPTWSSKASARNRIRVLGKIGPSGLYTCYSQVTTAANNLDLALRILRPENKIDLEKGADAIGYWPLAQLSARLAEKHSRAVFVKAKARRNGSGIPQFLYAELIYCDRPSIDRFVDLVSQRNIVFEFTMSERADGSIRNHGYPWRLIRECFLEQLFAFQIKLR